MAQIIIPDNMKILSIDELMQLGLTHFKINKLVEEGILSKLNRKNYMNMEYEGDDSDLFYVYAYVPSGVVCLMSAAIIYGLTTFRPDCIEVAVSQKKRVTTLPDWPTIRLHYFDKARFQTGVEIVKEGAHDIQIYDIEKTVVDIIYFRNKIGVEETKEVLINYLKRDNRNINRLCRYAEKLKCKEVLGNYLEVLL